jgi:hypothetical protein
VEFVDFDRYCWQIPAMTKALWVVNDWGFMARVTVVLKERSERLGTTFHAALFYVPFNPPAQNDSSAVKKFSVKLRTKTLANAGERKTRKSLADSLPVHLLLNFFCAPFYLRHMLGGGLHSIKSISSTD